MFMIFDNEKYIDAFDTCSDEYKKYVYTNIKKMSTNDKACFWKNMKENSDDIYISKVCDYELEILKRIHSDVNGCGR